MGSLCISVIVTANLNIRDLWVDPQHLGNMKILRLPLWKYVSTITDRSTDEYNL